jgi:hypothetical protein
MKPSTEGIIRRVVPALMQKLRFLDKHVDELAKGKTMEKILRKEAAES